MPKITIEYDGGFVMAANVTNSELAQLSEMYPPINLFYWEKVTTSDI